MTPRTTPSRRTPMSGVRLCLLTTQRTGSSWFLSLLDSHPDVRMFNEPFLFSADRPGWDGGRFTTFFDYRQASRLPRPIVTARYLQAMHAVAGPCLVVGFKLMYDQLRRFPELLPALVGARYRFVHLVRENYLDIHLSMLEALHRRQFHAHTGAVPAPGLVMDPKALRRAIRRTTCKVSLARGLLRVLPVPVLEVRYRDLMDRGDAALGRVLRFLSLDGDTVPMTSEYVRIGGGAYRARIVNYEDVRAVLRKTRHTWMLPDEP